jgi:hypothetical protein
VVVDDFDIFRSSVTPAKTDTPLIVEPDAELTQALANERLEPVAGRCHQFANRCSLVEQTQLADGDAENPWRQPATALAL